MERPHPAARRMSLPVLVGGGATAVAVAMVLLTAPGTAPARVPTPAGPTDLTGAPPVAGHADCGGMPATPSHQRPRSRRRVALAMVGGAVIAGISPVLVLPAALGAWAVARQRALRAQRQIDHEVRVALPDAVDLLLLCCGAGLSLPLAHPQVADRVPGRLGAALRTAATAAGGGHPRADALADALGALGDRAAGVGDVLVDHLRYGAPLLPGLERLSAELRLDRRRHAEESARRVPVQLLGPLIACTLPAFAVLTVVPLVAASLHALPT